MIETLPVILLHRVVPVSIPYYLSGVDTGVFVAVGTPVGVSVDDGSGVGVSGGGGQGVLNE